jgi:hypothetical protein
MKVLCSALLAFVGCSEGMTIEPPPLMGSLPSLDIGGTATVAPGLSYPHDASLFIVRAPADYDFEALACMPSTRLDGPFDLIWGHVGSLLQLDFPIHWGINQLNTQRRLRVHAVLVADTSEGLRRLYAGLPPLSAGDFFGATGVLEASDCGEAFAADEGQYPCLLSPPYPFPDPILIDQTFEGCGGRSGT